eukprot:NODE_469_length_1661_cov_71.669355_g338_i0.p1 GENE.NODE_469_length_1661_cov_71.669355_g338_i0~~NODE_469_length_1661_cov_71.669355_g338_i0.p1  ORF type:complete len:383 (-),score=93.55 NODE_469_length_1661_cov_71.669355_g338_i0:439-1587(-)
MEFEHVLLKTPLELMGRVSRTQHKALDKDYTVVENALKTLLAREQDDPNVENTCNSLDKIIVKLRGMKRKLEDCDAEMEPVHTSFHARIRHLKGFDPEEATNFSHCYNTRRTCRIIAEYFLRRGYLKSAEALASKHNMKDLVDIEVFKSIQPIVQALQKHNCTPALAWCKENSVKLKKQKSTLEVHLRLQEFIELALGGKKLQAVEYAQKHIGPHAEQHMDKVKVAMAVLYIDKNTTASRYKGLVDGSRWDGLVEEFMTSMHCLYGFTDTPMLHLVVQAGILALNTQQAQQSWSHNVNDPMCSPIFQSLAKKLPFTYKKNSSLVCRMSGAIMDGDNPPVVLPNGHVYSYQALFDMWDTTGAITCPVTKTNYLWDELTKAFVM